MGGKGGATATNDQMVQFQMQQAAEAKQQEQERQARLKTGTEQIKQIFEGTPHPPQQLDLSSLTGIAARNAGQRAATAQEIQSGQNVTWDPTSQSYQYTPPPSGTRAATVAEIQSGQNVAWDPASQTYQYTAPAADTTPTQQWNPATGQFETVSNTPTTSGTLAAGYSWGASKKGTGYSVFDPQGNEVANAPDIAGLASQNVSYGGGPNTGGFQQDFYDKYRQAQMDYYLPQEAEQYRDARSKLAFSLARAGSLNSSIAGQDISKLAEEDMLNKAQIASQADTATAGLRQQIAQNEQTALNQLYSTEDPSVAIDTAQNLVANAQLTKPILNPLGPLFSTITAGVGNAISGFTNPYAYINPNAGTVSAQTSSGSQTSGGTNVYG